MAAEAYLLYAAAARWLRSERVSRHGIEPCLEFAFLSSGEVVAFTDNGVVILRDVATGVIKHMLHSHFSQVNSAACSPDSKTIASALVGGRVQLWDIATGVAHEILTDHPLSVLKRAC